MRYILSLVWKIAFFVHNFGLEYKHILDWIIDCLNALKIVENSYFINKTYLRLAGNAWNIEFSIFWQVMVIICFDFWSAAFDCEKNQVATIGVYFRLPKNDDWPQMSTTYLIKCCALRNLPSQTIKPRRWVVNYTAALTTILPM